MRMRDRAGARPAPAPGKCDASGRKLRLLSTGNHTEPALRSGGARTMAAGYLTGASSMRIGEEGRYGQYVRRHPSAKQAEPALAAPAVDAAERLGAKLRFPDEPREQWVIACGGIASAA
jgi:hypothetical protein